LALPEARYGEPEDQTPGRDEEGEEKGRHARLNAWSEVAASSGDDEDRKGGLARQVKHEGDPVAERRDCGVDVNEDRCQGYRVGQPGQGPKSHLAQLHHLPEEQEVTKQTHHHRELNRDRKPIEGSCNLLHDVP